MKKISELIPGEHYSFSGLSWHIVKAIRFHGGKALLTYFSAKEAPRTASYPKGRSVFVR